MPAPAPPRLLHAWPEPLPRFRLVDYGCGPEFEEDLQGLWRPATAWIDALLELARLADEAKPSPPDSAR